MDAALLKTPGKLVDVGGHRLHLIEKGKGTPVVVFDSGVSGPPSGWALVWPGVAEFTRVCVYDRAGYSWSDPTPQIQDRTSSRCVGELHELLRRAKVPPPYVLVGHSFGGLNVRLYTARYPEEVVGLVLVEPVHEAEFSDRFPAAQRRAYRRIAGLLRVLQGAARLHLPQGVARLWMPQPFRKLPPEAQVALRTFGLRPGSVAAARREVEAFQASAWQVRHEAAGFDSLPLTVVRGGRPGPTSWVVPPWTARRIEAARHEADEQLARSSRRGALLVAERSGHNVQIDQPDLVVDAIRRVVRLARGA